MVWSNKPTLRFWIHGPSRLRRCSVAKRVVGRPATMDRALVRRNEALVGGRIGSACRYRSGRRGDDRRDVRFASSDDLEWLGPYGQCGGLASLTTGPSFDAATRAADAPTHTVLNRCAGDLQPCRARRLPRAAAPAPPGPTTAVAPSGSRDVTSARECAGGVDLSPHGDHRKGHVDLGVG